jgi:hypothetical protein
MREAGLRDRPSPDLSFRERLAVLAGSRPKATTITTTMSKDNPRIFASDDPSATQCVVVEIEALIQTLAS